MAEKIIYKLKHVGINCENEKEAKQLVSLLCSLFDLEPGNENDTHIFVDGMFEVMKDSTRGKCGHIALQTPDVELAMTDLARKGISFKEETIRRDADGKVIFVYLDGDIGGFSFHLTK